MNDTPEAVAPVSSQLPPFDPQAYFGVLMLLELEKLRDNPNLLRIQIEPAKVESMASTIDTDRLHEPVIARPGPLDGEYELLSGRLRVEAFRLLRDRAQTPEERQKYSAIPTRVIYGLDDAAACRWSIAANAARVANNPLEMSGAVKKYMEMTGEAPATVSQKTGLTLNEVEGLVRLASAPDFIQAACGKGLGDDLPARATGEERSELGRRRLKLTAALEFIHLYEKLSRHSGETDAQITRKVKKLIRQALVEDWGWRAVQAAVRELIGHRGGRRKEENHSGRAAQEMAEERTPLHFEGDPDAPKVEPQEVASAAAEMPTDEGRGAVSAGPGGDFAPEPWDPEKALKPLLQPGTHPGYTIADRDFIFHEAQFAGLAGDQRKDVHDLLFHVMDLLEGKR